MIPCSTAIMIPRRTSTTSLRSSYCAASYLNSAPSFVSNQTFEARSRVFDPRPPTCAFPTCRSCRRTRRLAGAIRSHLDGGVADQTGGERLQGRRRCEGGGKDGGIGLAVTGGVRVAGGGGGVAIGDPEGSCHALVSVASQTPTPSLTKSLLSGA